MVTTTSIMIPEKLNRKTLVATAILLESVECVGEFNFYTLASQSVLLDVKLYSNVLVLRLSWFTWMTSKREAKLRFLLQKTDILIKRFKKQQSEYIVRCKFDGRIHKIIFTQKFIEEHRTNLMRHCYDSKLLVQPKMGKVKNYCQFVWCQCKLDFKKFRRNIIIK